MQSYCILNQNDCNQQSYHHSYLDIKRVGLLLSQLFLSTRLWKSFIVFLCFSVSTIVLAEIPTQNNTQQTFEEKLKNLAKHKQWQHLIFYKKGHVESISADFYLSQPATPNDFNSYDELVATINKKNDMDTVCRYPARYYWLTHHLEDVHVDLSSCQDLPNTKNTISLVLVSSYLKNPASSFGHVLVKINDDDNKNSDLDVLENSPQFKNTNLIVKPQYPTYVHQSSGEDLLSQSYNFGARMPEKESSILYILKGLFGFYDSGFSQAEFFKQDAVYSKTEQRDMWEYVLKLQDFEQTLLHYHLHEAQQARFSYYFIKQNCGYRSGEILELVSGIDTTQRLGPWYAPDYIFDQLVEFRDVNNETLIEQVRYIPSEQSQLNQKIKQLPNRLQQVINMFIETESLQVIENLNEQEKSLVIDYLIMHRNYKLSQESNDERQLHHENIKKQLMSKRFTLPVSDALSHLTLFAKTSPAESNKTTKTAINISSSEVTTDVSLFYKDPLNNYLDINKSFETLKLSAKYTLTDKPLHDSALTFDEFLLIGMQQIENINKPLADEPMMSWQLAMGIQEDPIEHENVISYVDIGVGQGVYTAVNNIQILGYGFLNAHVHSQKSYVDVSTQVGLRLKDDTNSRAMQLEHIARQRYSNSLVQTSTLTLRQGLDKNNDIRIEASYIDNPNLHDKYQGNLTVGFNHYW